MEETDVQALHKRAELLGVINHDDLSPDDLRKAIEAREHGADPRQAQQHVQDDTAGDEP
ncbi:hypothetical protein [Lentzea jiangxiensis]|uniref:Uncharacterized protein n=1 Tax=Lentzea jiangxiensis TaxID=641025 RepID=A0A1H0KNR5_9PSEU|nr:hypothetical protein [Lentzea jiangxiensis]SDO57578.1 hypothetical protein SAMN05421507_10313 [Lentzea jiangxiensis]